MKYSNQSLIKAIAICALLNIKCSEAVKVQSAEAQLEEDSFLQIDEAFDDAFKSIQEEVPASSTLLQINKREPIFIQQS